LTLNEMRAVGGNEDASLLDGQKTWVPTFVGMTRTADRFRSMRSGMHICIPL